MTLYPNERIFKIKKLNNKVSLFQKLEMYEPSVIVSK